MHALRSRIRSRPVLWFYVVAVLLSWSYWFILLASGARVAPGSSATHLPGLMGPMISAVLIAWL
ncbi:MAG: CPBP family intramembrane metalloprotease, partial [Gammaproteobacteria bacterium]|nr:CPBP family intramembrane metalloprotease [Gammaproteobacteria bacterium]